MNLHIIARGKIGRGPEAELVDRYVQRIGWPVQITELPDSGGKVPPLPAAAKVVTLDETGRQLGSVEFARQIGDWREQGIREIRFLIGAADGLTDAERASADLSIAFGKATWPHLMARAMLAEQLWRASSILANHPYHREG
ncbi:23S rRNA (pseudouridine(1915)-N(3))-methyltransferase RlmH [Parasphingopyxis algicola]|uniref:23S rRNA (pseudouridine(1915)-N(3))-methyltransferase RlmH n=1 Tax=Parasphingopyxis algicola TaxID=2026624 RepID=UPI0015A3C01C|nr:23S rRNA (pseudouridine(1915)-N(3))-methyltransferase RlmH [Parasphingopyxis algicola]QLC26865.1 23S rRNA (pseudouridine(1915)-N(3))-methyltransferase RlmH [Parasphingopyxis algicola]